GIKQTYMGVKSIFADAGAGDDVIDLRNVRAPAYAAFGGIRGGAGDDTLYAGRGGGPYYGNDGDDTIIGNEAEDGFIGANDEFHGGTGNDTLTGNQGDD